ncbi:MAG: 4-hydroxy-tetrahydrodipicolinate reductase [Burkholderiales bacterium]
MRIALIGCGAMGQLVGKLAAEQGHEVGLTLRSGDAEREVEDLANALRGCDVAIDFSVAAAVPKNVAICAAAGLSLAEGTTGWHSQIDEVRRIVTKYNASLIYGANFSVGVQVFYRMAARASELFRDLDSYDAFIEEAHHKRKRDAPSGTALQVKDIVQSGLGRDVTIASTRAGYIPGTHRLGFDSPADQVLVSHAARSRAGFAAGALMAAGWIIGRRGIFEFSEMFDRILQERK